MICRNESYKLSINCLGAEVLMGRDFTPRFWGLTQKSHFTWAGSRTIDVLFHEESKKIGPDPGNPRLLGQNAEKR